MWIDKYEYFTVGEILPSVQRRVIEQDKFTYSPLGKVLEKQRKIIEVQGRKQTYAITNQNGRLAAVTNKDDHKETFERIIWRTS